MTRHLQGSNTHRHPREEAGSAAFPNDMVFRTAWTGRDGLAMDSEPYSASDVLKAPGRSHDVDGLKASSVLMGISNKHSQLPEFVRRSSIPRLLLLMMITGPQSNQDQGLVCCADPPHVAGTPELVRVMLDAYGTMTRMLRRTDRTVDSGGAGLSACPSPGGSAASEAKACSARRASRIPSTALLMLAQPSLCLHCAAPTAFTPAALTQSRGAGHAFQAGFFVVERRSWEGGRSASTADSRMPTPLSGRQRAHCPPPSNSSRPQGPHTAGAPAPVTGARVRAIAAPRPRGSGAATAPFARGRSHRWLQGHRQPAPAPLPTDPAQARARVYNVSLPLPSSRRPPVIYRSLRRVRRNPRGRRRFSAL